MQVFSDIAQLKEGCDDEWLRENLRLWVLTKKDQSVVEFIDTFNSGISYNQTGQQFQFPGKSLDRPQ